MTVTSGKRPRASVAWCFAFVLLVLGGFSGPALSQDAGTGDTDVAIRTELVAPSISTDELAYLLIPLTKSELDPLATGWLEIVRDKTAEISERQVALLNDPSQATDAAYQELARMVCPSSEFSGMLGPFPNGGSGSVSISG